MHAARQATENAIKTGLEGRLSFSRALTRYKNRVQSVLCHSKGAGHVAKSFRTSGPERIFKTELLAIPCVPPFGAACVFRHSRLGARSAVPGCMRVPPFPVRCVIRYKNMVQSVLCHSKGAGHVVKSSRKSGPERIFKTELLAYF